MRVISLPAENLSSIKSSLSCSSCRCDTATPIGAIEEAPILLGCSPNIHIAQDRFLDFKIYVCNNCGLIQTDTHLSNASYEIVHSHAVGSIWTDHRDNLWRFISESLKKKKTNVKSALEIGPSINPILKNALQTIPSIYYFDLINEPPFDLKPNEHYEINSFPLAESGRKFDLIVASHVIEHSNNIHDFLVGIKHSLEVDGMAVLSTPNFYEWLTGKYWNAITSEHLNYPFTKHIKWLCDKLDLFVEFAYFKSHSVFMRISSAPFQNPSQHTMTEGYPADTQRKLRDWITELNSKIDQYENAINDSNQELLLAGASHLSQYISLMSKKISSRAKFVLDNAIAKHGKRLYGTDLIAQPFELVKKFPSPIVIVPISPYKSEMIEQIGDINPEAQIIS